MFVNTPQHWTPSQFWRQLDAASSKKLMSVGVEAMIGTAEFHSDGDAFFEDTFIVILMI